MQKVLFLTILLVPLISRAEGDSDTLFTKGAANLDSFEGIDVGGTRRKEKPQTSYHYEDAETRALKDGKKSQIIPTDSGNKEEDPVDVAISKRLEEKQNQQNEGTVGSAMPSYEPKETQDIRAEIKNLEPTPQQNPPQEENLQNKLEKGVMSVEYYKSLIDQVKEQTDKTTDENTSSGEYQATSKTKVNKVTEDNRF